MNFIRYKYEIKTQLNTLEIDNAINGVNRETKQRFDLKGSKCEVQRQESMLTIIADDDMKLRQMQDLILNYAARRKIDMRSLDFQSPQNASGGSLRQPVVIKQGINQELSKKIMKAIRGSKIKVQVTQQGQELRVSGNKRDDLQSTIQFVKELDLNEPLDYVNFRD